MNDGGILMFLATARRIVEAGPICDSCLGSAFGRIGHGWTNEARARALRDSLEAEGVRSAPGRCWVCQDAFATAPMWAERAALHVRKIEFETYLFAVRQTMRWQAAEELLVGRFELTRAEPQKHAWNRAVGKAFEALVGHGTVDFSDPDIKITIDLEAGTLDCRAASLFVSGRYRKLARGIPQTHWPCRRCRGRGCEACQGTGKQYAESVEELIAGPFVRASGGAGAILHGAGREDIDARMLGTGRPFVLEVTEPRVRGLDLARLSQEVNLEAGGKVEVSGLSWARRDAVQETKETPAEKTYRAVVEFGSPICAERLAEALRSLIGAIEQRTPRRVAHRRADLVRVRVLHSASGVLQDERHAELVLHTDGGLYVKELVSGDEGRTEPSLAGRLGVPARVHELDVIDIAIPGSAGRNEGPAMDSRSRVP